MAHGKRHRAQLEKVQRDHAYPPAEAVALLKETASAKFDETVELHVLLGVNVRHAEEQLRGTLALPHGLGKDVTVAWRRKSRRRAGPTSTSPSPPPR